MHGYGSPVDDSEAQCELAADNATFNAAVGADSGLSANILQHQVIYPLDLVVGHGVDWAFLRATRMRGTFISTPRPKWFLRIVKAVASVMVAAALLCASQPSRAQLVAHFTQQGPKLVSMGASCTTFNCIPSPFEGSSIALSGDGTTLVMGGPSDNSETGAAWVFTQSGGVWTQQGSKLVGSGNTGLSDQGTAVALSSDGNTLAVGGRYDGNSTGATWVFTRSGGVWSQQGSKLVGSGVVGQSEQGCSVALSADGNTLIVGGCLDNGETGAAWVFTRSGGVWTQQGPKLVGSGAVGTLIYQGTSVALSADGNTALVGGTGDNSYIGAAWVFT